METLRNNIQNIDVKSLLKKPLFQMTGEEFLALSNVAATQAVPANSHDHKVVEPLKQASTTYDSTQYVFGLDGIGRLLGVGKSTAAYYKETFLKPAIIQGGPNCKIRIKRSEALRLFEEHMRKNGTL